MRKPPAKSSAESDSLKQSPARASPELYGSDVVRVGCFQVGGECANVHLPA